MNIVNLAKSFGERKLFDGLTVNFGERGLIFLVGRSGCGKSTLLNILGLIENADEGMVRYSEKQMSEEELRRSNISYIFQEYNLFNTRTVENNLKVALAVAGIQYDANQVDSVLKRLNLLEQKNEIVSVLSGGEKQRVAIARAALKHSRVILADEPSGNLDEENARECFSLLKEMSKESLVIVVTHDIGYAEEFGDKIYRLENQELILQNGSESISEPDGSEDSKMTGTKKEKPVSKEKNSENSKEHPWVFDYFRSERKNKKQKILTVLLSALIIMALIIALGMRGAMSNLFNEVNRSVLENDYYSVCAGIDKSIEENYVPSEIIRDVENNPNVLYSFAYGTTSISVSDKQEEVWQSPNVRILGNEEFFTERFENVIGKMPVTGNEVALTAAAVKELFPNQELSGIIGKEIVLHIGEEQNPLVVVGIHDTGKEEQVCYMTEELYNNYNERIMLADVSLRLGNQDYGIEYDLKSIDETSPAILYGQLPEASDEVCVSRGLYRAIRASEDVSFNPFDTNESISDREIADYLFGKTIRLRVPSQEIVCRITAVSGDAGDVVFCPKLLLNRFTERKEKVDIYLNDIRDNRVEELEKELIGKGFTLSRNGMANTKAVGQKMAIISIVMFVVAALLVVILCGTMVFFIKAGMNEKYYEIGVLKSIGASEQSIRRLLFLELVSPVLASAGICVVMVLLAELFNVSRYLTYEGMPLVVLQWWNVPFAILIALVVTVLACFRIIRKISKMKIVDTIRRKNQ